MSYIGRVSNLHRLAWIDAQIRAGRHPNATTIARRFEISRRQAARDVEYLRYSMGAPLAYSSARNGYEYTDDAFVLPAVVMSDAETSALTYLAERYSGMDGEGAARLGGVLRRLAGRAISDPGSDDRPPVAGFDSRELRALDVLRAAIDQRQKVNVRYRGGDGVVTTRTMAPYAVLTRLGSLSCIAYCDDVGVTTALPLARFEAVERLDESYEVPPVFDLDEWADERSPLPQEPFVAVVRLDEPGDADRLESVSRMEDGHYRLEFYDSPSLVSALLACRGTFEVIRPAWLRQRVLSRLSDLLHSHGG